MMPASGSAKTKRFDQARPVDRVTGPRRLADDDDERRSSPPRPAGSTTVATRQFSFDTDLRRARSSRGTPWPRRSSAPAPACCCRSRTVPGSAGSTCTNLPFCTCMPTRHVLPIWRPTSILGAMPLASKSCMLRIAVSRLARVIEFGSPLFAFIVSLTARAKISPAMNAWAPKPSGVLSYLRNPSRSAFEPLSSNGRKFSQTYWPSTALPPS